VSGHGGERMVVKIYNLDNRILKNATVDSPQLLGRNSIKLNSSYSILYWQKGILVEWQIWQKASAFAIFVFIKRALLRANSFLPTATNFQIYLVIQFYTQK
jgi:hypothetical protein